MRVTPTPDLPVNPTPGACSFAVGPGALSRPTWTLGNAAFLGRGHGHSHGLDLPFQAPSVSVTSILTNGRPLGTLSPGKQSLEDGEEDFHVETRAPRPPAPRLPSGPEKPTELWSRPACHSATVKPNAGFLNGSTLTAPTAEGVRQTPQAPPVSDVTPQAVQPQG